ncbi:hypothetical protein FGIG_05911 [Fasciola gigantica]|uniref:Androglobin domain-containing protein n=1 Tax=Fasciola gigantica TaxID=46835 RepID=A0A504Z2Q0_FASGI|nr:hypothetical protein FGIG_05911 [Fasciola gigantica]
MAFATQKVKEDVPLSSVGSQRFPILATRPKEFWIDIAEFCDVFNVIDVYHKPQTYPIMKVYSDLKHPGSPTDRTPGNSQYIFVDSIHPSEILFSFSAICRWPLPLLKDTNTRSQQGVSGFVAVDEAPVTNQDPVKNLPNTTESAFPYPIVNEALRVVIPPPPAATLIVESQHWLVSRLGEPVKRLDVTGSRTISLLLPPGRHSYRLLIHAPMGYVLQILGAVTEIADVGGSTLQTEAATSVTTTMAIAVGLPLPDEKAHVSSPEKQLQVTPKTSTTLRTTASARVRPSTSGQAKQACNTIGSLMNLQLGDEDTVLTEGLALTPMRMRLHAQRLVRALGQFGQTYSDLTQPNKWLTQPSTELAQQKPPEEVNLESDPSPVNEMELYSRAQNYLDLLGKKQADVAQLLGVSQRMPLEEHAKLTDYRKVLLGALQKLCAEDGSATADMNLAWRVTQFDMTTPNPLGVVYKPCKFNSPPRQL